MNIISLGVFGIIYLVIFGLITNNQASWDQDAIDRATIVTNCPYPIQDGRATNFIVIDPSPPVSRPFQPIPPTFDLVTGVNGTGSPTTNKEDIVGTRFTCFIEGSTVAEIGWFRYQATEFNVIPVGWYGFVGDSITSFFSKFYGYLVITGHYFMSVINTVFPSSTTTIMGFALGNIHPTALYLIVFVNITMLIMIIGMMYKFLSPFTSGGG